MLPWLIPAFVLVPMLELYLLLLLGQFIGFWPTIALTVGTGVIGGALAKREGLRVLREWVSALDEMRTPGAGLIEAVLVLIGGILLLTPGVLTDIAGVLLLVPPTRRFFASRVRAAVERRIASGRIRVVTADPRARPNGAPFIDTAGESADTDEDRR